MSPRHGVVVPASNISDLFSALSALPRDFLDYIDLIANRGRTPPQAARNGGLIECGPIRTYLMHDDLYIQVFPGYWGDYYAMPDIPQFGLGHLRRCLALLS
jgi:hypothetical protein